MAGGHAVVVGYNPDFAPLAFARDGVASGLMIERLHLILGNAEVPFDLCPLRLPEMIASLCAGKVALLVGIAATAQRHPGLAFSRPIVISGGAWFTPNSGTWPGDADLSKPHLPPWRAVTPATGPLADLIRQRFAPVDLQTSEDYDSALQTVLNGRADAAALNWQVGRMLCEQQHPSLFHCPGRPFCTIPLTIAAPPGDPDRLLPRLNAHIPHEWGEIQLPGVPPVLNRDC